MQRDRRFDAVIFDLFGTLVDYLSEEEYTLAFSEVARMLDVPAGEFRKVWRETLPARDVGRYGSLEADLRNALVILGVQAAPDKIEEAANLRLKLYTNNLQPRSGALDLLAALRSMGYKLGIVTACACEIPMLWNATPFPPLLDAVVFSCTEGVTKPDARIYLAACERLGVGPERCLYIGDGGSNELTGAQQVGMHPVLIERGFRSSSGSYAVATQEWAGARISSLAEVLPLLE